jgi:hypothetical protein
MLSEQLPHSNVSGQDRSETTEGASIQSQVPGLSAQIRLAVQQSYAASKAVEAGKPPQIGKVSKKRGPKPKSAKTKSQ